jgi:hypothetical protein
MFSLAILVCFILVFMTMSGPASLILNYFDMPFLAVTLAALSIVFGVYCCFFALFPISLIGFISASCGVATLSKL